jgi:hypothetical protein
MAYLVEGTRHAALGHRNALGFNGWECGTIALRPVDADGVSDIPKAIPPVFENQKDYSSTVK